MHLSLIWLFYISLLCIHFHTNHQQMKSASVVYQSIFIQIYQLTKNAFWDIFIFKRVLTCFSQFFLDNNEFFLWFIQLFSTLILSFSMINFCDWLCLYKVLNVIQSCSFVWVNNNNKIYLFFSKSTSLLHSLIVYVNTMCIKFILMLHTLICLLVFIYSINTSFYIQFKFDLICFFFDM